MHTTRQQASINEMILFNLVSWATSSAVTYSDFEQLDEFTSENHPCANLEHFFLKHIFGKPLLMELDDLTRLRLSQTVHSNNNNIKLIMNCHRILIILTNVNLCTCILCSNIYI